MSASFRAQAALEGSEARGKKRPRDDGFGPGEEEGGEEEGEQPRSAKKQKAAAGGGGKGGRKEGPGVDKLKEAKRLAAGAKALARRGLSVKQVQKQHKQREKLRQGARAAEGDGDDAGDGAPFPTHCSLARILLGQKSTAIQCLTRHCW